MPHYDGAMEAVANFSFAEMEAIEDPAAKLEVRADAGTRLLGANEMPTPIYFRQKGATMRNIALVLTLAALSLLAQSSSSYRVTHTYTLGGDGSWDYIVPDPPNHRLFIARQNRVMVVDEDSGKLLGFSLSG